MTLAGFSQTGSQIYPHWCASPFVSLRLAWASSRVSTMCEVRSERPFFMCKKQSFESRRIGVSFCKQKQCRVNLTAAWSTFLKLRAVFVSVTRLIISHSSAGNLDWTCTVPRDYRTLWEENETQSVRSQKSFRQAFNLCLAWRPNRNVSLPI